MKKYFFTTLIFAVCLLFVNAVQSFADSNRVDFGNHAILGYYWQDTDCNNPDWCEGADLDTNGTVDFNDLALFVDYWLLESTNYEQLINDCVGFGRNTTGGAGGILYTVDKLSDDGSPGTLRHAINYTNDPVWIRFAVSGTIQLTGDTQIVRNKTIDGRGANILIKGGDLIISSGNVIIHNIKVEEARDDGIRIQNGAEDVWINHVAFKNCPDGLLDIIQEATDITVSWCRFEDHVKTLLIGAENGNNGDENIRVTMHHNYFNGTERRNPRIRYGKIHYFNNYLYGWKDFGAASTYYAQFYSENNIYHSTGDPHALVYSLGSLPYGYVSSNGDREINCPKIVEYQASLVFHPSDYYSYSMDSTGGNYLMDKIKNEAGRIDDTTFPW